MSTGASGDTPATPATLRRAMACHAVARRVAGGGHGPAGGADAVRAVTVQVLHRLADEGVGDEGAAGEVGVAQVHAGVEHRHAVLGEHLYVGVARVARVGSLLVESRASAVRRLCTFMAFMPASCAPSLYVTR